MENLIFMVGGLIVLVVVGYVVMNIIDGTDTDDKKQSNKKFYDYEKKEYFLTRTEKDLYSKLSEILGGECEIFPQAHLSSFLNHEVKGQNWKGALAHIQRKSVDFLICDKRYLSPKLAIEFDDPSHDRKDRIKRDEVVEGIFKNANMPLLRIRYDSDKDIDEIAQTIRSYL